MGYHVVDPDELEATPDYPCERRGFADAGNLSTLAAAVYRVAPGEQLPREYHSHETREELFYVHSGTLTVCTPEETYTVGPDAVFVAEPQSPHLAHVPEDASEPARVLGVGAPSYDPAVPYEPAEDSAEANASANPERDRD